MCLINRQPQYENRKESPTGAQPCNENAVESLTSSEADTWLDELNGGHWGGNRLVPKECAGNHRIGCVGSNADAGAGGESVSSEPCCAILSTGLGTISSTLSSVIGGALNTIRTTLNSIETFQRTIVWPQALIDRARAAVGSIQGIFNDIRALGQVAVASATLPATRQLEQTLLSRDPAQIGSVGQYTAVYSAVPLPRMHHRKCVTSST